MSGIAAVVALAKSQTAVAKALGVSPQAVQQWVRQGFAPLERCQKLEELYGVPVLSLMSERNRAALRVAKNKI